MKKIQLILALCALITLTATSQPYVNSKYNRSSAFMSSANHCNANVGFMMACSIPFVSSGAQFFIDRTDPGGAIGSNSYNFDKDFTVTYAGCASGHADYCYGVSMIETTISGANDYAVTAAFDKGVIFLTLGSTGTIINNAIYYFPSGAFAITKPLIAESTAGNEYFICGSYSLTTVGAYMYVIKVNTSGTVLTSRKYQIATSAELTPKDMTISPYTPSGFSELVIVGSAYFPVTAPDNKPFLIRLKQSDLSNIECKRYGQLSHPSLEWFSAITPAASTTGGGNGFVVTGHNDSLAGTYPVWAEKLTQTGNPMWSHLFQPRSYNKAYLDGIDVIERFSTAHSSYQYFTATNSTGGMQVLKFDDAGNIFTSSLVPPIDNDSEFLFQYNTSTFSDNQAVALSFLDNGATTGDIGLHVYGTLNSTSSLGSTCFVESPFNGWMNCSPNQTTNITSQVAGPRRTETVGINNTAGLTQCINGVTMLSSNSFPTRLTTCSISSIPTGGSNNKIIASGIIDLKEKNTFLNIFPNPTEGKIQIQLNAAKEDKIQVEIFDVIGRLVYAAENLSTSKVGTQTFEIDLEKYSLKEGIYYLQLTFGKEQLKQKVIFAKN